VRNETSEKRRGSGERAGRKGGRSPPPRPAAGAAVVAVRGDFAQNGEATAPHGSKVLAPQQQHTSDENRECAGGNRAPSPFAPRGQLSAREMEDG
jgi:hypothetical protein